MERERTGNRSEVECFALVPKKYLEEIMSELREVKRILKGGRDPGDEWVDSATARKMLHISQKTWQVYRNKNIIPFSQHGRKIYVRRSDLESYMKEHFIPTKNK